MRRLELWLWALLFGSSLLLFSAPWILEMLPRPPRTGPRCNPTMLLPLAGIGIFVCAAPGFVVWLLHDRRARRTRPAAE